MQNIGLSPLEGVYCCSREKPALALEATGLSANRGPRSRKVGKTHTLHDPTASVHSLPATPQALPVAASTPLHCPGPHRVAACRQRL